MMKTTLGTTAKSRFSDGPLYRKSVKQGTIIVERLGPDTTKDNFDDLFRFAGSAASLSCCSLKLQAWARRTPGSMVPSVSPAAANLFVVTAAESAADTNSKWY